MTRLDFSCRLRWSDGFQLDATFAAGDGVTALVGPSGSGKTTVLHLIAGLLQPDEGRIALDDRTLTHTARRVFVPPHRRRVGIVFQDYLLFPHLSVRENLQYGQRRRAPQGREFDHVVELLELGELLGRRPGSLSGGEKQRTALGRALLSGPDLLLLDEPVSAVDDRLKDRILRLFERVIREYQLPTLFVSHNPQDVQRLADRVIAFEAGKATSLPDATTSPTSHSKLESRL
jgi:molybdate transport system ATP-binding protein